MVVVMAAILVNVTACLMSQISNMPTVTRMVHVLVRIRTAVIVF